MKINGNEVRPGNILEYEGKLWNVLKTQHTQPGKGGAFMQVEMKALRDKTKLNVRFRSAETVERVFLEEKEYQYLYSDGSEYFFMDQESFEQIPLNQDILGAQVDFLQENMIVKITMYEGEPVGINIPQTIVLTIAEADPVVKGQTATSSFKPAVLENGVKIMVPQYIESGEKVVVDTRDVVFVERAK